MIPTNKSNKIDVFGSEYEVEKKIDSGTFGDVYLVSGKENNNSYALKVEDRDKSERTYEEYKIYQRMHRKGMINIPKIINFFRPDKYNMLIMELLGDDLNKVFLNCGKKFTLGTVLHLAVNILNMFEKLHNIGYVHRDIKPNNFALNYNDKKIVYLIDFGLTKRYVNSKGKHMSLVTDRELIGTARYTSVNIHLGFEPSRRDDLESIGYMLVFFMKGKLPWQGLKDNNDSSSNHYKKIKVKKLSVRLSDLCSGLPKCFVDYLDYCRKLKFDQKPDYDYLRNLFLIIAKNEKVHMKYQWC